MRRHPRNPILTRADIPRVSPVVHDVSAVFNPGAVRLDRRHLLLLRVQTRGRETVLMPAESPDGVGFTVLPRVLELPQDLGLDEAVYHVYDPRLTLIDGEVLVTFSADTDGGCRVGVARLHGAERLELIGVTRDRDTRNAALFPQRIGGRYLRLERPNRTRLPGGVMTGDSIFLAESVDLVDWRLVGPVLAGRPHYWDELIGSGPPPVRVREGWLHIYHGVATHFAAANVYQAGVCLLDADEPTRVLARGRANILEPRESYEQVGQVPNVVFPTGIVVDSVDAAGCAAPDSRVRVYYGAADTCVCLAETSIQELLEACRVA